MLGIRSIKKDGIPENPSAEEITNFNETGRRGPSSVPGMWRLDLIGPKKSLWNKSAVRRFRRHFLKCEQYGDWPAEQIERALFVHMDTLRSRYHAQTGQKNLDERLQMAIKAARISRLKTVSVGFLLLLKKLSILRIQLCRQRLTACQWEEDLADFMPYVQKLCDKGGMSGDESDNSHQPGSYRGQANYFRIRPAWRAPHVSTWLDTIDKVYVAFRFQENLRATPGNWIRKRHPTNRVDEKRRAVIGLPGNFYDVNWLNKLTRKQRKGLRMVDDIPLDHTSHVMRYVELTLVIFSHSDADLVSGLPLDTLRWRTGQTSRLMSTQRKITVLRALLFETPVKPLLWCEYD